MNQWLSSCDPVYELDSESSDSSFFFDNEDDFVNLKTTKSKSEALLYSDPLLMENWKRKQREKDEAWRIAYRDMCQRSLDARKKEASPWHEDDKEATKRKLFFIVAMCFLISLSIYTLIHHPLLKRTRLSSKHTHGIAKHEFANEADFVDKVKMANSKVVGLEDDSKSFKTASVPDHLMDEKSAIIEDGNEEFLETVMDDGNGKDIKTTATVESNTDDPIYNDNDDYWECQSDTEMAEELESTELAVYDYYYVDNGTPSLITYFYHQVLPLFERVQDAWNYVYDAVI